MPELFVDRFLSAGSGWIDLATGASVRLRVAHGPHGSDAFAWSDRCGMMASLRHPVLNELLDFGAVDSERIFEAYIASPAFSVPGVAETTMLRHAVRFLEAHGVPVAPPVAELALRPMAADGQVIAGRAIGIVLQPRPVLEAIVDALVDAAPGGVTRIDVTGEAGLGIRTLRTQVARSARLQGYVPVCANTIARMRWIVAQLRDRHVCVLVDNGNTPAERTAVASFIAELGLASPRRHVVCRFWRGGGSPADSLRVEPMGVTAMVSMVYVDGSDGPSERRLYDAARTANGNPSRFLRHLRACRFERPTSAPVLVHETSPPYLVEPAGSFATARPSRVGASLLSAEGRAVRLAQRGRHASATRLLTRAIRVLEARHETSPAAACATTLGWILRDRGRNAEAVEQFTHARALAPGTRTGSIAAVGIGVVWTDECRFAEAEAALRALLGAGDLLNDQEVAMQARVALTRCLLWQKRLEEAELALSPLLGRNEASEMQVRVLALLARIRVDKGDYRGASAAAADACRRSVNVGPRAAAVAERSAAILQITLGNIGAARTHVTAGLASAAAAHLPLAGLRLRATFLEGLSSGDAEAARLVSQIRSALEHRLLSPLLRNQLESALATVTRPTVIKNRERSAADLDQLQRFMEMAHGASDDAAALDEVTRSVCEALASATVQIVTAGRERRLLARAGRPWAGESTLIDAVLASGLPSREFRQPPQAAEPIRYGNEVVAVLASRWAAGSGVNEQRSAAVMRAAALALATTVRGVLDRIHAPQLDLAWRDLIGSSGVTEALRGAIARAARAPFPVLIQGESGSGKELVARAIHRLSARRDRRLCALNCAALSDDLLEAELFGHTRGAFTGAVGERAGLFEEADGGTLFLDEVGELSPRAQAKLLRVLQDGEVRRVGENMPRRVDARVIAATNRQLDEDAENGRFRADLRFRLDVVRITVPPLRDRPTDIPELAARFWEEAARRVGSRASLAPETLTALTRFDWPGNVRQLQNVIASLAVEAPRRGRVGPSLLPAQVARSAVLPGTTFDAARAEFERRFLAAALARAGGNRARAARSLGVTRQGLAKMLRRLHME